MSKEIIPADVELIDAGRTLGEKVYRRFSDHELGQRLKGSPRFHAFMPEGMDPQVWINTISLDGDNLKHMLITHDIMAAFIFENDHGKSLKKRRSDKEFTEEEKELLLFTALVHDMAESEIGDIPGPLKTNKDHEEEMIILSGMLYHFMGDDKVELDKIDMIGDVVEILSDHESKLGRAFRAVEIVGYSKVAFKGWNELQLLNVMDGEKDLKQSLSQMSQDVVLGDLYKLMKYAEDYPYVKLHLMQHQKQITDIIAQAKQSERHDIEYIENCAAAWGDYKKDSF